MKSNLLFYLLFTSLLMLFLYSCGSSSNGVFEKRKHLKGWHFHKKSSANLSSSYKKSKENRIKKKNVNEFYLSNSFENLDQKSSVESVDHHLAKVSKQGLDDSYSNLKKKSTKDYNKNEIKQIKMELSDPISKALVQNSKSIDGTELEENISKSILDETALAENIKSKKPKEPYVLNPFERFPRFLLIYLLGIAAVGILTVFIVFSVSTLGVLATLIIALLGLYFILVFFIYYILRLYLREDGVEIWSLKKTFSNVGLIYFPLVIGLFLLVMSGF